MYEDQPQELVHDLISEATFGSHPLGRPVIGRGRGDLERHAPHDLGLPPLDVRARQRRRGGGGQPEARGASSGCSCARSGGRAPPARKGPRVRPPLVKPPPPEPPLPAQGHRAVPRLRRRARDRPLRPAPLRRVAPRRDPRRLGLVAPLPGDPREARHGLRGLQLRRRSTPTPARSASTSARARTTSPPASRSRASRSPTSPAATCGPSELERAKENLKGRIMLSMESTSNRMSRLGKSLITDTELLSIERIMAEIDAVEPEALAELAEVLLAPEKLSAAGIGPERGALPRSRRAREPGPRQRGVKVALFGRGGKVGAGARAGARGRRARARSSSAEAEAMVDFTAPDAVVRERRARLEQGVPCVVGTSGWEPAPARAAGAGGAACRSSSRPTSRSARC